MASTGSSRAAIAVVTSRAGAPEDDRRLVSALAAAGAEARIIPWDDVAVDWGEYTAAVVRSTWDYHERAGEFLAWVEAAGRATRLLNPPEVIAWNAHKSYLAALDRVGIPVVPTWHGDLTDAAALDRLLTERDWAEAIVKPAVSASSHRTFRADRGRRLSPELAAALPARDFLVQPYLSSVESKGELSLVLLGGELSHALRKVPRAGDFRSQVDFGGTAEPVDPPAAALELARAALRAAPAETVYARADLLPGDDGRLLLGELELVEPCLHLGSSEGAADRFAAAILGAAPGASSSGR